jgi:hypothetical protein
MSRRTLPRVQPEVAGAPIFFNGIHGATGGYLRPSVALPDVVRRLRRRFRLDSETLAAGLAGRGLRADADPSNLAEAGWGVVFPRGTPSEVRDSLGELLTLRREMAGARYREMEYLPGETKRQFLVRHGVGSGVADAEKVPYYILLVGDPESIPFEIQFHLGVQRAVGRLWLETDEDRRAYARHVAAAETVSAPGPRRAAFFAPDHPGDELTHLSAETLVRPLASTFQSQQDGWDVRTYVGPEATRDRLAGLLGGGYAPALLFTASHGLGFTAGDDRQLACQGAILCQEWPGPAVGWSQGLPESWYFSGEHVPGEADLNGLIAVCFACHSAGTPRESAFKAVDGKSKQLAPRSFVACLPQRLLAAGARAVVGHVDQSWQTSFLWSGAGAQRTVFESALWKLARGHRVGDAMAVFGERWAEIAIDLQETADESEKTWLWLAHQDARGYVVLGDPAVRVGDLPCAPS